MLLFSHVHGMKKCVEECFEKSTLGINVIMYFELALMCLTLNTYFLVVDKTSIRDL